MFATIASFFAGRSIKSLLTDPRIILSILLVLVIGFGVWKWSSLVSDNQSLREDNATLVAEKAQLETNNEVYQLTIARIRENVKRVEAVNNRLEKQRDDQKQRIQEYENRLKSIDLVKEYQDNPTEANETVNALFQQSLECLIDTTGDCYKKSIAEEQTK